MDTPLFIVFRKTGWNNTRGIEPPKKWQIGHIRDWGIKAGKTTVFISAAAANTKKHAGQRPVGQKRENSFSVFFNPLRTKTVGIRQFCRIPPYIILNLVLRGLNLKDKYHFYDLETNKSLGVGKFVNTSGSGMYSGASENIYYVINPTLFRKYPIYITMGSTKNTGTYDYLAYNKEYCDSNAICRNPGKAYAIPTVISRLTQLFMPSKNMPPKKGGKKSRKARNKRRRTRRRHSRK